MTIRLRLDKAVRARAIGILETVNSVKAGRYPVCPACSTACREWVSHATTCDDLLAHADATIKADAEGKA